MSGVPWWFKYLCVLSVVAGIAMIAASFLFVENGPRETFVWLLIIGIALAGCCCIVDWNVHERGEYAPGSGWASHMVTRCCNCGWCGWMVQKGNRTARAQSGLAPLVKEGERQAAPFAQVVDVSKLRI